MTAAELKSEVGYVVSGDIKIIERFWEVPLNYEQAEASSEKIRIFGRTAVPVAKEKDNLPTILYLQGGPGFECQNPKSHPLTHFVHDKGYQILYLDQRGTGLSNPISADTVLEKGGSGVAQQARWLSLFRANSIVKDCEAVRENLLGSTEKEEDRKWTLIGQSYGGFIATHYLSTHPEGLKEVFTTGGMPPLVDHPDEVYKALYEKVIERNEVYYKKFPQDTKQVRDILKYLHEQQITLPNGGHLTPRRFLQLGLSFGTVGGIDGVHDIVLRAASEISTYGKLSYKLLQTIEQNQSFDGNLIYAILHESIYCQKAPSVWSANRLLSENEMFNYELMAAKDESVPVYFTGEMIYPWMFTDYTELRKLKPVAEEIAQIGDWPILYDVDKLKANTVPVNSAIYVDDMYVDFDLAHKTAKIIGNHKTFITSAMMHDALRTRTSEVMTELFKLSKRVEN
ncbi:alpha/beta-hydrolase [Kalaharituber pfeilii]|nr:alpha/beta-hydrolase [Kalaharituber pfeilii]